MTRLRCLPDIDGDDAARSAGRLSRSVREGSVADIVAAAPERRVRTAASVHNDGWVINGCPVNGPRTDAHGNNLAVAWFSAAEPTSRAVNVAFSRRWRCDVRRAPRLARALMPVTHPAASTDRLARRRQLAIVSWVERAGAGLQHVMARHVNAAGQLGTPQNSLWAETLSDSRASLDRRNRFSPHGAR